MNRVFFPINREKPSVHFPFLHLPDKPKKSNMDWKKFPTENSPLTVNENSSLLILVSVEIKYSLIDSSRTQKRKQILLYAMLRENLNNQAVRNIY
jgi:hypothetical protein